MALELEQEDELRFPAVWQPRTTADARQLAAMFGENAVFAGGGTLLRTWWESGIARPAAYLIDLSLMGELTGIGPTEEGFVIGAMTTLSDCLLHPVLTSAFPVLTNAIRSIAAPSVRNLGTLGGNVCGRTGDALPALLVYDAELVWQDDRERGGLRKKPLFEWLAGLAQPGRNGNRLSLLTQIRLPAHAGHPLRRPYSAYHKTGRREAFTPSLATAAQAFEVGSDGTIGGLVRAAAGGGQTLAHRLTEAEALLTGASVHDRTLPNRLYECVMDTFHPRADDFAGADYRKRTAASWFASELWKLGGNARTERADEADNADGGGASHAEP